MDLPEPVRERAAKFYASPLVRLCLHLRYCSECVSGETDFCRAARELVSERNRQLREAFLAEMEHDESQYLSDDSLDDGVYIHSHTVGSADTEVIVISDDDE